MDFIKSWFADTIKSFQSLISFLLGSLEANVLIVGLGNAGKTTLMNALLGRDSTRIYAPTRRPAQYTRTLSNVTFTAHDMGGQRNLRQMWTDYARKSHAIAFVVDTVDMARLDEAIDEFERVRTLVCADEEKRDSVIRAPIVLIGNKYDIHDDAKQCLKECDLSRLFRLPQTGKFPDTQSEIRCDRRTEVFMISAKERWNHEDPFIWIAKTLHKIN